MKFQTLVEELNQRKDAMDRTLRLAQESGLDAVADKIDAIPALREKVNLSADTYSFDLQLTGNKQDLKLYGGFCVRQGLSARTSGLNKARQTGPAGSARTAMRGRFIYPLPLQYAVEWWSAPRWKRCRFMR